MNRVARLSIIAVLALLGSNSTYSVEAENNTPSFRDEFSGRFLVGAALNVDQIMGREIGTLEFVARQFSALTAENEMKWERIHPRDGSYEWLLFISAIRIP